MREWLIYYLLFIAAVSLIIAAIVLKLKVRSPLRLIILVSILIASPVALSYIVSTYFNPLPETMVPDLVGKSLSEAREITDILNLQLKIDNQVGSSEIVSFQRPEGGRIVKIGRIIYVTIGTSLPQSITETPSFEGEIERKAKEYEQSE